ncbi:site-specific integrase [Salmonella enterica subsp. enterica serovar Enteritidis]|uniref:tyrosine-type recombinase/integrase n=1 Tax=Pseudomonas fulva TaxID=47880 RepID=UPI0013876DAC|nr:site-specific integrase [Pseudomonas fulva]EBV3304134.1 site-specific integrase [Salmonella enterica subsp. enterica serovar Enteritidis]MBA1215909.1 site-specific integrase [Pseudomonas fulva]
MTSHLPDEAPPEPTSSYSKVVLSNVKLWKPCASDQAMDWIGGISEDGLGIEPYPVERLPYEISSIHTLYVILQPDGSIWRDGSLYLYSLSVEQGKKAPTLENIAGDLCDFMNKMQEGGRDYLNFEGESYSRPTYYYKAQMKKAIQRKERSGTTGSGEKLGRGTANRKITSMIGFYRWMVNTGRFKPQQAMWVSTTKYISYDDRHGFRQSREIICTDLTFRKVAAISIGDYIEDGGKLYPIPRENQQALMAALVRLHNPEMLLIYIIALATGMRIQSILNLRYHCIRQDVGSPENKNRNALYAITIGGLTNVGAKGGKEQHVLMPAWLHYRLTIYLNSQRYKDRNMKSPIRNIYDQYLFLTRTGKPYYVAEEDSELFGYSNERGSAIRQFATKILQELAKEGLAFKYQFHDLRATFSMNLIEDNMKLVEKGEMSQLQLLDLVRRRLNHSSVDVSMRYLRFRLDHPLVAHAQSEFESHLEGVISEAMIRHEGIRS